MTFSSSHYKDEEQFTFFYRTASPFSQFHSSTFTGQALFPEESSSESEHLTFFCCEQWMMYNKAKLFRDEETASLILKARTPPECKRLGRQVRGFDDEEWRKHNRKIIYEGNKLKFTQNPNLFQELKNTKGTTLVEASPTDRIYGIGLDAKDPRALKRSTWRGQNLLGEALTTLRDEICV